MVLLPYYPHLKQKNKIKIKIKLTNKLISCQIYQLELNLIELKNKLFVTQNVLQVRKVRNFKVLMVPDFQGFPPSCPN